MDEVSQHFKRSAAEIDAQYIFGVFDVDLVLFTPGFAALQAPNVQNYSDILHNMLANLNNQQQDILANLLASETLPVLIDQQDPKIIKKIEEQGVKLIALTTLLTGAVDNIPNYEVWRYLSLKDLDIDFSKSFPGFKELRFTDVPRYCGRYPVFYQGVLNANGAGRVIDSKGDILIKFLQKVKFTPKNVILVSNRREDLVAVEMSIKVFDNNIKFLAIYYTAAESYPLIPIEEAVFVKTWEKFIERAKHLSKKITK